MRCREAGPSETCSAELAEGGGWSLGAAQVVPRVLLRSATDAPSVPVCLPHLWSQCSCSRQPGREEKGCRDRSLCAIDEFGLLMLAGDHYYSIHVMIVGEKNVSTQHTLHAL